MKTNLLKFSICVFLFSICQHVFGQQVAKNLVASNGVFIGFYEYKPVEYSTAKKYPLIIFLHGVSERGNGTTELSRVTANAIPKYIKKGHNMSFNWNGRTETFLVLSPQLSSSYGSWPSFYVEELIKYAKQNLSIDTNRIIVTGISLGGGGTWKFAGQNGANPKSIAALAPICGTLQSIDYCNISRANLPTWAFHATNDAVVSVDCTNRQVSSIINCSPSVRPIKTIWPTGGHVIWDKAYDTTYAFQNPNIFEWFLAQDKSLPVNSDPIANAGTDNVVSAGKQFVLNGSLSSDRDGKIVRYIWKQIGGPVSCTLDSVVSYSGIAKSGVMITSGTYQFELKVIDERAAYRLDTVNMTVLLNTPPIANAGIDTSYNAGTTALLKGNLSGNNKIISQKWELISGPVPVTINNPNSLFASFFSQESGTYIFRLTVSDSLGLTGKDEVTINIFKNSNPLPVARAGSDTSITSTSMELNGINSSDDKGIITYRWGQVSGPNSASFSSTSTCKVSVSNLIPGRYVFRLRVWDAEKNLSYDDIVLIVK